MRGKKTSIKKIGPSWIDQDECLLRARLGEDADEVLIGDPAQKEKFIPQVQLSRWNKEESLYLLMEGFEDSAPVISNERIEGRSTADATQGFYFDVSTEMLKFGLILYAKPKVNSWSFKLQGWEDFNFYPQPPLKNLNPDGSTWEEIGGRRFERPVEVNDSYAIYHKTKRHNQYKTGKAFHDYRIRWVDAVGNWVWGELSYDKGIRTVTAPQNFLDMAVYPVRANDTFGQIGEGASWGSIDNFLVCLRADAPASGTITKLSGYIKNNRASTTNAIGAVYAHDTPNNLPEGLLANSSQTGIPASSTAWRDLTVSRVIVSGTPYWLGIVGADYYPGLQIAYDNGTGMRDTGDAISFPTLPNPYSNSPIFAGATWGDSIYATYTPGISLVARQKTSSFGHLIVR